MKPHVDSPIFQLRETRARSCALGQLRGLLASIRARHPHRQSALPVALLDDATVADPTEPTLHDFHAVELEAAFGVVESPSAAADAGALRHDDPQELRRARFVFVAAWLLPFLLVSGVLGLFGGSLDRASTSLLEFSLLGLAIPLAGSLLALVSRNLMQTRG